MLSVSHLERILLFDGEGIHRRGKLSHLVQGLQHVVSLARSTSVTGARGVLGSVDEAANGTLGCTGSHDERQGRERRACWVFMRKPVSARVDGT